MVSRDRVLSDNELRIVWLAAEKIDGVFGAFVQLLMLLGQRRNETAGIAVGEVDVATWTIPASRAKNDVAHDVPLSPVAQRILAKLKRDAGFYLSTDNKHPISGFSKLKKLVDDECLKRDTVEIPPWTFHDLRRSVSTGMGGLGVDPHIIEAVLNHQTGVISGIAGTYNRHTYGPEKAAALAKWSKHLEHVIEGKRCTCAP